MQTSITRHVWHVINFITFIADAAVLVCVCEVPPIVMQGWPFYMCIPLDHACIFFLSSKLIFQTRHCTRTWPMVHAPHPPPDSIPEPQTVHQWQWPMNSMCYIYSCYWSPYSRSLHPLNALMINGLNSQNAWEEAKSHPYSIPRMRNMNRACAIRRMRRPLPNEVWLSCACAANVCLHSLRGSVSLAGPR